MGKIYTEEGWVNWDYILSQSASFISVVGARGVGKTYGVFRKLTRERKKFIYLRRLKSQLDQCGKPEGNPFKKINDDTGTDIRPFPSGGIISFRETDKNGSLVAVGVALSVVANIRGIDFSDYDYIVFDEFISSAGERPIKNEFQAFLNFYETVNRNRELEGKQAVSTPDKKIADAKGMDNIRLQSVEDGLLLSGSISFCLCSDRNDASCCR